jgi:hypothetical protein
MISPLFATWSIRDASADERVELLEFSFEQCCGATSRVRFVVGSIGCACGNCRCLLEIVDQGVECSDRVQASIFVLIEPSTTRDRRIALPRIGGVVFPHRIEHGSKRRELGAEELCNEAHVSRLLFVSMSCVTEHSYGVVRGVEIVFSVSDFGR